MGVSWAISKREMVCAAIGLLVLVPMVFLFLHAICERRVCKMDDGPPWYDVDVDVAFMVFEALVVIFALSALVVAILRLDVVPAVLSLLILLPTAFVLWHTVKTVRAHWDGRDKE